MQNPSRVRPHASVRPSVTASPSASLERARGIARPTAVEKGSSVAPVGPSVGHRRARGAGEGKVRDDAIGVGLARWLARVNDARGRGAVVSV